VRAAQAVSATAPAPLNVKTEPYHPSYFVINGRSMPDDMDANYAPNYPNQPLQRQPPHASRGHGPYPVIGQGRFQHHFTSTGTTAHLGRDGNLILAQGTTTPTLLPRSWRPAWNSRRHDAGQAFDGIFYWSR